MTNKKETAPVQGTNAEIMEALARLEEQKTEMLTEATSMIYKMTEGEEVNLALYHPDLNETLEGDDGKAYEVAVTKLSDGSRALFGDVVVLSTQKKLFLHRDADTTPYILCRFIHRGMKGDKNKYRNIQILTF